MSSEYACPFGCSFEADTAEAVNAHLDEQHAGSWVIEANPHLRIGPQWYTVATFETKVAAEKYLDEHRPRLIAEEGTNDFRVIFEED